MSGSKGFANAKDSSGKTKLMILSYLQFLFPNECGGAFLLARFCEVWEISPVSGDLGRYDLTHGKWGPCAQWVFRKIVYFIGPLTVQVGKC